ncbi:protein-disulfide reductase DsbD [Neisseriaceae bacterium TC5R-5]|nr:protein-disulfide reductase DsbD [Neisseriaceae bacterium TC5R-5]
MPNFLPSWFARLLLLLTTLLFCLGLMRPAFAVNPDDLLPAEQAFAASVLREGNQLRLMLEVAPDYYLYRDRISISSTPPVLADKPVLPVGVEKKDPYFGLQVIYTGKQEIIIPLRQDAPPQFQLTVRLQGCSESGVCYPPYTHQLTVGGKSPVANKLHDWLSGGSPAGKTQADSHELAALSASHGWPSILLTFFMAGVGMAFTACMYPLLPIVSSLLVGQGGHISRWRGFGLSFAYVQGLALSYTVIGVIAGLTGSLLTVWLQQPAVVLTASGLMVLFALSMFDLYTIQLPTAWQSSLAEASNRLPGGRVATVFLMGVFSALLIGPCVAPPLALALGYIGSSGDALLGAVALYVLALGIGLPLLLLGAFGGHILPRAGSWMKAVKASFGVVMLGVAIWLASPFLPVAWVMLLWAMLFIGCAVFLNTFEALTNRDSVSQRLAKILGLLLFLVGVAQLAGVLAGASNPRYPLKWGMTAEMRDRNTLSFQSVSSNKELDVLLASASKQGKPVLLDFYADWCVTCKEMEAETFSDPQVGALMQGFMLLQVDVTANSKEHQALLKRFGLYGPPGIILFDGKGQQKQRVLGFSPATEFAGVLQVVAR